MSTHVNTRLWVTLRCQAGATLPFHTKLDGKKCVRPKNSACSSVTSVTRRKAPPIKGTEEGWGANRQILGGRCRTCAVRACPAELRQFCEHGLSLLEPMAPKSPEPIPKSKP